MAPSPEADRATLLRRLSLDLTGLPPAPEEARAFLRGEFSYDQAVERYLASPHFGEQWARHWLDLARYADSDGYEKDFYRPHAWRWRDWVIESINRDQPIKEFIREQIAGDLLPGATIGQKIATGFNRNNLLNREGGVDIEEDRCKIVVDRVSTLGTAMLGLTVGCAECHNHKYDPISQRDFYRLYAFFNSTDDRDIQAPRESGDDPRWRQAQRDYAGAENAEMESWARGVAALPEIWTTPAVEDYELPTFGANNGANLYPQEDGSFLVTGMVENKTHYIMMLNTRLEGITGIRVEAMTDEMLPKLGPGWAADGNFVLSEVLVESAPLARVNELKRTALRSAVADYSQPGFPVTAAIDGQIDKGGWAIDMPKLPVHAVDRCAVFATEDGVGVRGGTRVKVSLVQNEGNGHTLGRVRVSYTTAPRESLGVQAVPQRIRELARKERGQRSIQDQADLKHYFQSTFHADSPELAAYAGALSRSEGVKGSVRAQVLSERGVPRPTHVHVRGNFLDKGEKVEPGFLPALPPGRARGARPDRLDLANWLVDDANPLTARVAVNQVWQKLFGEGLVSTAGDFGTQGDLPSHPGLLDWLAAELRERNWSRKELIRLLVQSAVYRQSSAGREEIDRRDARNRLLARQNRFRLTAENGRDQFLSAGGLLEPRVGGPSTGPEHRRGLYLPVRRAHLDYLLSTFDAPLTTQSCPKRERSNTPLQALTLLNDKIFIEAARGLARASSVGRGDDAGRVREMFWRGVGRPPDGVEEKRLSAVVEKAREFYAGRGDLAAALAGLDGKEPATEGAAWVVVARTILNLDEVITRE